MSGDVFERSSTQPMTTMHVVATCGSAAPKAKAAIPTDHSSVARERSSTQPTTKMHAVATCGSAAHVIASRKRLERSGLFSLVQNERKGDMHR